MNLSRPGLVLQRVRPKEPMILHTDFSGLGISVVLGQLDAQGRSSCVRVSLAR